MILLDILVLKSTQRTCIITDETLKYCPFERANEDNQYRIQEIKKRAESKRFHEIFCGRYGFKNQSVKRHQILVLIRKYKPTVIAIIYCVHVRLL